MKCSLSCVVGCAGVAASLAFAPGCRTVHSRGTEADSRVRPMPATLEPEPLNVQPRVETPRLSEPTYRPVTPITTRTSAARASSSRGATTTPYVVKQGDSLSTIAYRYRLRWQDVQAVNPTLNPKKLRVGQTIRLPGRVDVAHPARTLRTASAPRNGGTAAPAAGGTHTVKRGEALSLIARQYGIKTADLRQANNLTGDMIREGQKLKIPGKSAAAAASTATAAPVAPAPVPPPVAPPVYTSAPVVPPPQAYTSAPPSPVAPLPAPVGATGDVSAASAPQQEYQTHRVVEGEDLYMVAIRWGVGPTDLKTLNNLTSFELTPGMVLKIPVAPAP